ncbi:hypothetical protein [Edaphobacter modestus]|uniref:Uncharacterized protein n=1 Tax=Edaphobacter modestus TaxID=388466 RepID=A0A4Q7YTE6_9BACT|nr:hypothetical protein [Edaphobacter modestus]RZU40165.1 hypothetical protein BDD14_1599 [Edaphobacter modestus]
MDTPRITPLDDDTAPFDANEFDAGYLARLSGEPQCLGATRGWRAGRADADAGCRSSQESSFRRIA